MSVPVTLLTYLLACLSEILILTLRVKLTHPLSAGDRATATRDAHARQLAHADTDAGRPMDGSLAQLGALDKLFADSEASGQAKTSYGKDAPVAVSGMTPGMIGPPKAAVVKAKPKPKAVADRNEIWDADAVNAVDDEPDDGRPQAEYEIVYKQNVSPEDMFLGVDPERHAGVSCSDALLLKVLLPGTKLADIELDVRETFVRVQAPKLKLKAWLPEKVDATKGNAKWDGDKETLAVTLPIIHDPLYGSVSASNEMD